MDHDIADVGTVDGAQQPAVADSAPVGTRPDQMPMSIQSGILKSLGINLYTNLGKVLVEFIANAYDGDATKVTVTVPTLQDAGLDLGQSFLRLKESMGSLLLVWSRLEDALAEALGRVPGSQGRSIRSFAERLTALNSHIAELRAGGGRPVPEVDDLPRRLDEVRRLRNLIAHRLTGICADPARGEPHIVCERGDGGRRTSVVITQAELSDLLVRIDRCTRDLGRVGLRS